MSEPGNDRVARGLLVTGAIAGIALAAFAVVRSGGSDTAAPADAIALVNGQALSREAFARFAAAIAAERRSTTLDASEQRRLLDRMIDEELLLQRGIALGLERYEPSARGAIVSALVASVTADAETAEPDDAALRAFYAQNQGRFGSGPRLTVDVAFVATAGRPEALARERAETLARRLRAGEAFAAVRSELGDPWWRSCRREPSTSTRCGTTSAPRPPARRPGSPSPRFRIPRAETRATSSSCCASGARTSRQPSRAFASRCARSSCAIAARRR